MRWADARQVVCFDRPSRARLVPLGLLRRDGARTVDRADVADLASPSGLQAIAGYPLAIVDLASLGEPGLRIAVQVLAEPRIARTTCLVVAVGADQLDLVGDLIGRPHIRLLCDPEPIDWSLALDDDDGGASLHDPGPEDRIRRLHDQVEHVSAELANLTHALREQAAPPPAEASIAEIRAAIRSRQLRDSAFPGGLFADPAWNILLDLLLAHLERRPVSISSVCIAAGVPTTTALRWIATLERAGLVQRRPDAEDRRRIWLSLSPHGVEAMSHYVGTIRGAGVPLV
jgi:hypothetical protein